MFNSFEEPIDVPTGATVYFEERLPQAEDDTNEDFRTVLESAIVEFPETPQSTRKRRRL